MWHFLQFKYIFILYFFRFAVCAVWDKKECDVSIKLRSLVYGHFRLSKLSRRVWSRGEREFISTLQAREVQYYLWKVARERYLDKYDDEKWSLNSYFFHSLSCLRFTLRDYRNWSWVSVVVVHFETREREISWLDNETSRWNIFSWIFFFLSLLVAVLCVRVLFASLVKVSLIQSLMMVSFALTFFMWFSH